MIKTSLHGFIGSDANIQTHKGKVYFNFSVANNFSVKVEDDYIEKTSWEKCFIVINESQEKLIEFFKDKLVKGTFAVIDNAMYRLGKPYEKEGVLTSNLTWYVKYSDITIIDKNKSQIEMQTQENSEDELPEDLPF